MQVLAAELSIQPHLEINYLQQGDHSQSSMIVLMVVATTIVTVTVNKRRTIYGKLIGNGSVMENYAGCGSSCNSHNLG